MPEPAPVMIQTRTHKGSGASPGADARREWIRLLPGFVFMTGLGLYYVFFSDIVSVQDNMGHHLYSRYFWKYPELMLSQWQRPLYTLLTAGPALAGYRAQCLVSVLSCLCCAVFAAGMARHYGMTQVGMIPVILSTLPVFAETMGTTMSEAPFSALLASALWAHLKGRHSLATMLASLTPLIRPEGAIVILIWFGAYLWRGRWRLLPLLLVGAAFWLGAAWVITGDPLHPLAASYRFKPGLRGVQWDYALKFYDDFSGPLWFVAATAGLVAWRGIRRDLVHAVYLGIFLFFMFVRDSLEDLPPGHFAWRFTASAAPLFACYALKGLLVLLRGRADWPPGRERFLRLTLLALAVLWTGAASAYTLRGNEYGGTLFILALLGVLGVFSWLWGPRSSHRGLRALAVLIVIMALGYTVWKVVPYRGDEKDRAAQELAEWWISDPRHLDQRVFCQLLGFYYYAGLDPIYHTRSEGSLPGVPGGIVIWDSWAMGRWGRIPPGELEKHGYVQIASPVVTYGFEVRVYRRPPVPTLPDSPAGTPNSRRDT